MLSFQENTLQKEKNVCCLSFLSAVAKFPENLLCIFLVVTNSASLFTLHLGFIRSKTKGTVMKII